MDIVVKPNSSGSLQEALEAITKAVENKEWMKSINVIKSATVPVIKVVCSEKYFNKSVDLTVYEQNHNGLECVQLVKYYLKAYYVLKPLVLVLKYFLHFLDLNKTYEVNLFHPLSSLITRG